MTHPLVTNKHTRSPLACTLQEEDWYMERPRIVAEEVTRGGRDLVEITVYRLHDGEDPDPDDDGPEISDTVLLRRAAWETLVQMFARRYPEAATRIVTQAQGWQGERK